ncbi:MAG: hypothetical protein WCF18_20295 [Chthoniobacteraceae bacterium]
MNRAHCRSRRDRWHRLRVSTSYQVSVRAVDAAGLWDSAVGVSKNTLLRPFVVADAQAAMTTNPDGSTTMTWPGYGYSWKFTVESGIDLATWLPIEPASQWPSYATSFTFTPVAGVPQLFYRVKAVSAVLP